MTFSCFDRKPRIQTSAGMMVLTLLLIPSLVVAEFTERELSSLLALRSSQRSVRSALLALEVNIASKTGEDTRSALGLAEHEMSEANEAEVNATYLLLGAAAERDDVVRDALRDGPRSAYVDKALIELIAAVEAIHEAGSMLAPLRSLRPLDLAWHLQIQRVTFYMGQAETALNEFDRSLPYTSPVLPVLQFDEGFQAFGQYGYDVADLMIDAWSDGPLFPNYKAYAGVLSQFWLVQNSGVDVAFRSSGVISGNADDSREALLGGGTSGVNQRLHGMLINLAALDIARIGRPTFNAAWLRIIGAKYSDCWRHTDRLANEVMQ